MDQSDQNNKRSMRLFALFLISTTAIFCALFFGSAIQKLIHGL